MQSAPSTLPRETRDTLLVLAAVALVLLPQVAFLPLWASGLALLILAWRLWMALHHHYLPSKWLLGALLVLAIGATVLQFRSIVGPQAGVVLVLLLLVLKTLEMRARRDAMVIFFLGFFSLVTLFLQSQSLSMASVMLLAVWGLLAALVNAHMPVGYPSLRQLLHISGMLMLLGAPLMLLLFISFPRIAPLWCMPAAAAQGRTGLSDVITVGQVASLANDHSVVMRLRFNSAEPPPPRLLYFRGPVLSHFDGRQWTAGTGAATQLTRAASSAVRGLGQALDYEITLQPHAQHWLLALDATLTTAHPHAQPMLTTTNLQWLSPQPVGQVLRYRGQAHLHYAYGEHITLAQRSHYLQLPAGFNPRTLAWAAQLRGLHSHDDTAIIQAALSRLSDGNYRYTLQPGASTSPHTADDFWWDSQQGFCEHIASAFVVLMRAAGIPARIVAGYQGGERNPVDGLWTVRQSDAHAWAEVWLPGEGWLRVDPTSAVAPARTEQLQRAPSASGVLHDPIGQILGPSLQQQLHAQWEAVNHRWNDWVIHYSQDSQSRMARHLGLTRWGAAQAAISLSIGVALLLAAIGWQRWRQKRLPDPWLRLMAAARKQLQQAGINQADNLGLQALAQAVHAQWGDESLSVQQWLRQMEQWRYAPHGPDTPSLATLRRSYRALNWPRSRTP